ncbi:MAG: hypothetical protein AAFO75_04730 [Pseudomonadota bacterium]
MTYRDDRFSCVSGQELLAGYKLADKAPTTRFVALCCNTGMFIKYRPGHWVSAYRNRFNGELPSIEMRNQIRHRNSDLALPQDAPSYEKFPLKLFGHLIGSRIAMMLGR